MAKKPTVTPDVVVETAKEDIASIAATVGKDFQAAAQAERGPTRALIAANPYTAIIIAFAVGNLIGVFLRV